MLISNIKHMGLNCYRIKFRIGIKFIKTYTERYAIKRRDVSGKEDRFYWRDNNSLCVECDHILKWMVENNVSYFSNEGEEEKHEI